MAEKRAPLQIEETLRKDMTEAQKQRDQTRLDTLRMALGAIHNLEIARTDRKHAEYGQPLTEADGLRVLEQEVKKRNQAIPLYKQGGRQDLVDKEQRELDILEGYLSASQASDDEISTTVAALIAEHGKEFRRVMPLAAKTFKGRADGARVQRIVKELTQ